MALLTIIILATLFYVSSYSFKLSPTLTSYSIHTTSGSSGSSSVGKGGSIIYSSSNKASSYNVIEKQQQQQRQLQQQHDSVVVKEIDDLISIKDDSYYMSMLKTISVKKPSLINDENRRNIVISHTFDRLKNINSTSLLATCLWSLSNLLVSLHGNKREILTALISRITLQVKDDHEMQIQDVIRLLVGMSKLEFKWKHLPLVMQTKVVDMICNRHDQYIDARDVSNMLYSLGRMDFTAACVASEQYPAFIDFFNIVINDGITAESATDKSSSTSRDDSVAHTNHLAYMNAMDGIARIGIKYNDIQLCSDVKAKVIARFNMLLDVNQVGVDHLILSITQSFAYMKVSFSDTDNGIVTVHKMLNRITSIIPTIDDRDLANLVWSLGHLHFEDLNSSADHNSVMQAILSKLDNRIAYLSLFDLRACLTGLSLMSVKHDSIIMIQLNDKLFGNLNKDIDTLDIFTIYDILTSLARMNYSINTKTTNANAVDGKGNSSTFYSRILSRTISVYHTFLFDQYGDIIKSLSALGYKLHKDITGDSIGRILAVTTRIYPNVRVTSAVNILSGLSSIGYRWDDFKLLHRSISSGSLVTPFSDSICKYLSRRISNFYAADYTALLYTLSMLDVDMDAAFNATLIDKIHHRACRVSSHMTSSNVAIGMCGLANCNIVWKKLPDDTKLAWLHSFHSPENISVTIIRSSSSSNSNGVKGIVGMSRDELIMTIGSMSKLKVDWDSIPNDVRICIGNSIKNSINQYTESEKLELDGYVRSMQCNDSEVSEIFQ